jgi:hypothetical protein
MAITRDDVMAYWIPINTAWRVLGHAPLENFEFLKSRMAIPCVFRVTFGFLLP